MNDAPAFRPRIAITLGDPAGIGPEIALKAVLAPEVWEQCIPVLVGLPAVCRATAEQVGLVVSVRPTESAADLRDECGIANVLAPPGFPDVPLPAPGELDAQGGQLAFEAIAEAVRLIRAGELDALCTGPISKAALNLAGHHYPGHTELLAEMAGAPLVAMLMVGGGVRVIPATIHCPLEDVPQRLTSRRIVDLLDLIDRTMADFRIERPRIAVCGLNPHAGEDGLLGREEQALIVPAIDEARAQGIDAAGPVPADVVFHQMLQGRWDVVLAMYHDQAMIPVKTLAFDRGVNVTLGLPFVRTSPDHGTAFDIAGRGIARPDSLIAAVLLAAELTRNRRAPAKSL